jgi:hypothetical protein
MKTPARDIDHLSLTVASPDALATRLQQLGFTLTPEGVEPRCLCFQPADDDLPNYIELVEGEPGRAIAVSVLGLEGEARAHSWETDDGFTVDAETIVGAAEAGPVSWFPVRHNAPEAFMEPEWIVHPNGALGMIAVHAVADDPAETAKALGQAWGGQTEDVLDGCVLVETGEVELMIWSPSAFQAEYKSVEAMAPEQRPAIVGVSIAVERARPLQALLGANNVPYGLAEGNRVIVPAEQTDGLMIEFIPQN